MLFEKYAGQSEQWWNFRWLPYSLTIQRTELIRGAYEQGIFLLHGNGVLALSSYGGIGENVWSPAEKSLQNIVRKL